VTSCSAEVLKMQFPRPRVGSQCPQLQRAGLSLHNERLFCTMAVHLMSDTDRIVSKMQK
jgi:hypothetical protein